MIQNHPIHVVYFAAVTGCAVVLALRISIAWLRHNQQRRDLDREPRCATCGYILANGTSAICPECGRDVREHGLITSRARPWVGIMPLYILLALVGLPVAMRAGDLLAHQQSLFGWRYHYEQMVSLSHDGGVSFGPPRYAVQSEGCGRYFTQHPDYVWVYCNSDGDGHPMLVVDLSARQLVLVDAAGNRSPAQPVEAVEVRKFLRLRSPNGSDTQLMNASQRIVSTIRAQMTGDLPSVELSSMDPWNGASLSYHVAEWVFLLMDLLSWILLSILLFTTVLRVKRRWLGKRRQLWRKEVARLGLAR